MALINSKSEINIINPIYAIKFGFQALKTDIDT